MSNKVAIEEVKKICTKFNVTLNDLTITYNVGFANKNPIYKITIMVELDKKNVHIYSLASESLNICLYSLERKLDFELKIQKEFSTLNNIKTEEDLTKILLQEALNNENYEEAEKQQQKLNEIQQRK